MASAGRPTLPGRDYHAPEIFELEREKVFFREWFYAGRADHAPEPGDFLTTDVVGESILVVRGKDGELRGFYNVCRHRGSRICDPETQGHAKGAIKCPYHAWSYAYDGQLIGTPLIAPDELDRSSLSLWPVSVDVWEGFVFVHLGEPDEGVRESFEHQNDKPLQYEAWRMDELRTAHRTVSEVQANWKVLVEVSELVAHQDYTICERAQQGVRSRAFTHGVYAEKDELPYLFNERYRAAIERP